MQTHHYCLLLAGGKGKNFWPCSRQDYPKQFLDFFGTGESLLQQNYTYVSRLFPKENIFIITNECYEGIVREQLPDVADDNLLLEPAFRNTAPAAAWGCFHIYHRDKEANILLMSCDQLILKTDEFMQSVQQALDFTAKNDWIVAFALKPTRPETECGYIQLSDEKVGGLFPKAKSYSKNPDKEFALMFLENEEFCWYTGMLAANGVTWLKAFYDQMKNVSARLEEHPHTHSEDFINTLYAYCPNHSVDRVLMENPAHICVMVGKFGWARVSTWQSLYEMAPKDKNENVILRSQTLTYDSQQNIVMLPKGKLAVLQDLQGYLVAEKDNVLVICKKNDSRSIRKFINDTQTKLGDNYL